jgi:histidinol-phosphate aminotransferase
MGYALDRRQWLKKSALALAGLMVEVRLEASEKQTNDLIMLDNNESPFGISPQARIAINDSINQSNRYPHRHYTQLIDLIAEQEDIPPDHIILGAGSTDVMVTLIHLVKGRGEILAADPTYFDFIYYADRAGCNLNRVQLNDEFEHDLEAMEKQISSQTDLVYICNPNNPTGAITPKDKLKIFCQQASTKALVVVDEAYHEYVEDKAYASMIDQVREGKNIIVTRTFSKIFGLAGLRIGYGVAPPRIIERLETLSRNFAPVAWLSLMAAVASYRDRRFTQAIKEKNKKMRQYLCQELKGLGLVCIPSHTNFVLVRVDQDARKLAENLEERKILVRPFRFHGSQWIRISCGTRHEMQAFLSALAALLA